jgi:hypothetical protein
MTKSVADLRRELLDDARLAVWNAARRSAWLGGQVECLEFAQELALVDPAELVPLAVVVLSALPPEKMMDVVDQVAVGAGFPLPPFVSHAHEARLWAASASPVELQFYAYAAAERLAPPERRALVREISRIGVAA